MVEFHQVGVDLQEMALNVIELGVHEPREDDPHDTQDENA